MRKKIIIIARVPEKIKDAMQVIIEKLGIGYLMLGTTECEQVLEEIGRNPDHPYILITGSVIEGDMKAEEMINKALEVNKNGHVVIVSSVDPSPQSKHHFLIRTENSTDWGGEQLLFYLRKKL